MTKIKLKELSQKNLIDLENDINDYLQKENSQEYTLLNITINNTIEHGFASDKSNFNAILILSKN